MFPNTAKDSIYKDLEMFTKLVCGLKANVPNICIVWLDDLWSSLPWAGHSNFLYEFAKSVALHHMAYSAPFSQPVIFTVGVWSANLAASR